MNDKDKQEKHEAEAAEYVTKISEFLKKSMRISGDVLFDSYQPINTTEGTMYGVTFKCIDGRRGTFFVTWTKKV